jgi:hypothetical protein
VGGIAKGREEGAGRRCRLKEMVGRRERVDLDYRCVAGYLEQLRLATVGSFKS